MRDIFFFKAWTPVSAKSGVNAARAITIGLGSMKKNKSHTDLEKKASETSSASFQIPPWVYPLSIGIAFVILAAWSWRKWTDPIIDMGRELYVPWQITQGKAIYRDIASLYGPFSSYVNAFFFKLFGISLTTIILCNLTILAGFTLVMYRFFKTVGDRIAATAACLVMLCIFSFSQYGPISNYNFITPYSHEAVHGLVLAIVLIYSLHLFGITRKSWIAGITGCCMGAVWLTKPEIAIASVGAVIVWSVLFFLHPARPKIPVLQAFLLFMIGGLLVPSAFFLGFARQGNMGEAFRAIGGMWVPLLRGGIADTVFFSVISGLNKPGANLYLMLLSAAKIVLAIFLLWITGKCALRFKQVPRWAPCLIGILLYLLLFFNSAHVAWQELARSLPLLMLLCAPLFSVIFFRKIEDWKAAAPFAAVSAWAVFSLLMLGKMLLNARIYQYGFTLALPATLISVWALVYFLPSLLSPWPLRARLFRCMAVAVIAAGITYHLQWSQKFYRLKTFSLTKGKDAFVTYSETMFPLASAEKEALDVIGNLAAPGDGVVVIPEGAMINYLSRRRNPTPYLNFLPPEMSYYGENTMLGSLKATCPEFIVLVRRNIKEFGEANFGASPRYGKQILDWINQEYVTAKLIGDEPFEGDGMGIKIMKRRLPSEGMSSFSF
jgi:hypothetical protein